MSEPSKEAYARADAALPPSSRRSEWQRQSVATALQGLMDERDDARRVARVLARICAYNPGAIRRDQLADLDTALAYPEPKTEEPGR